MISSIFAFILFLNAVLALPSRIPFQVAESSTNATGEMHDSIGVGGRGAALAQLNAKAAGNLTGRQTLLNETAVAMNCDKNGCTVEVAIGTPPENYKLRVDSSSGETWVGVNKIFVETTSTFPTGQTIKIDNGPFLPIFVGTEILDKISLGPNLVIPQQSIGVVNPANASEMDAITKGADGVLGLGRNELTQGIFSPNTKSSTLTVVDNLQAQGSITSRVVAVSSQPLGTSDSVPGSITFGGTGDTSDLTSGITFLPNSEVTTNNVNASWALDMNIEYDTTNIMSIMPVDFSLGSDGIVLNIPSFEAYRLATGASASDDGVLTLPLEQVKNLKSLDFTLFGSKFSLSPSAQIRPPLPGDNLDSVFLVPTGPSASTPLRNGFGAKLGDIFFEHFYTTFDSDEKTIGLATTTLTDVVANVRRSC